ncbi:MAG: ATP-binding protein [Pirellulales bacterium]
MNLLSMRSRISFVLACLLVGVLCVAIMVGLVPEQRAAIQAARQNISEMLAASVSESVLQQDTLRLTRQLQAALVADRELLSLGVRGSDGSLNFSLGDHAQHWHPTHGNELRDTQFMVPIRQGDETRYWLELRFQPSTGQQLRDHWDNPLIRVTLFTASSCYVLFFLYLGGMFEQSSAYRAVPHQVRAALDSLAEGLLILDNHERIVLANVSFAEWVGKTPEQLLGIEARLLPWQPRVTGRRGEEFPWSEVLGSASPRSGVELTLRCSGRPARVLIANVAPLHDDEGQLQGALVSLADVTQLECVRRDLDTARQAAESSRRIAEDANRAKSEFLARLSHEIRSPMNSVLGYTEALRRGLDQTDADRRDYLASIQASGEHLLALINDILDLSRIEAGFLQVERRPCAVLQILGQVVAMFRSRAADKQLGLIVEFDGPVPETIQSDDVRLLQILVNLVGNAIKFTEQGEVRIAVRLVATGTSAAQPPRLAFAVTDTGIGIATVLQQRIFEPFVQADMSIQRRFGGTGLGLAISRQLAEALGGGIQVQSEPGRGSTFTLTVDPGPLSQVRLLEGAAVAASGVQAASETGLVPLPAAHVLVADDSESNRALFQLLLSRAGAEVVTVENGAEVLAEWRRKKYAAILLDMQMPVLDGYATARQLRAAGYLGPIIALTALAQRDTEERCRAAGCSDFVAKPIRIDAFLAVVSRALGRPLPERIAAQHRLAEQETEESEVDCHLPLGDPEFLEIARAFVTRLKEQLAAMREAVARHDDQELALLAHWLEGSAGTAGFDAFTEPARTLENAAQSRSQWRYPPLLKRLNELAQRIQLPAAEDSLPEPARACSE